MIAVTMTRKPCLTRAPSAFREVSLHPRFPVRQCYLHLSSKDMF